MKKEVATLILLLMPTLSVADCEGDLNGNKDCPGDESYIMIGSGFLTGNPGGTGIGTCATICLPPNSQLPIPAVTCSLSGELFECEVWPQGKSLRYIWSATSNVSLGTENLLPSNSSETPYQSFLCKTENAVGRASVIVYKPSGVFTQASFAIPCFSAEGLPLPVEPLPGDQ